MNTLLVFLVAGLACVSAAENPFQPILELIEGIEAAPRDYMTVSMNEYVDLTMDNLKGFLANNGMDPMKIPDVIEGFSVKPLLITYYGDLKLTKGLLHDLSTISRSGNAYLSYDPDSKNLRAQIDVGFQDIIIEYDYLAKLMGLGPVGQLVGRVDDFIISVDIIVNLENFTFKLEKFSIPKVGYIHIQFKGNILTDWLFNAIANVGAAIFKNIIKDVVANEIYKIIQDTLGNANRMSQNFSIKELTLLKPHY